MFWKMAFYVLLLWGGVCAALTIAFFGRLGLDELRKRLPEKSGGHRELIATLERDRVFTTQPSRHRPG
jgi:hypothetical protein